MWRKRDSDNLESIAKSLEKLVEREYERNLMDTTPLSSTPFFDRIKKYVESRDKVKVTDGLNPEITEDIALEEDLKVTDRINSKISEARRDGNTPFWSEDLFDQEELETLES